MSLIELGDVLIVTRAYEDYHRGKYGWSSLKRGDKLVVVGNDSRGSFTRKPKTVLMAYIPAQFVPDMLDES